jgi:hypothetical protein
MLKPIIFLACVFLFFSCASSNPQVVEQEVPVLTSSVTEKFEIPSINDQSKSGHWITRSSDNTMVIIGVSNFMVRRDAEITAAKEDAAKKAAMYHGVHGTIESFHSAGANFFDYAADVKIELEYDTNLAMYIDRLTFDPEHDVVITDEAVFVRFAYAVTVPTIDFVASMNEGYPNWSYSRDMPQIDGYLTAVGFARNQVRLKDTINKSIDAAIARMIEDVSTQITASDKAGTGMGASAQIHTRSEARLNNFQILEFWIDPQTRYVYTLAIAQKAN